MQMESVTTQLMLLLWLLLGTALTVDFVPQSGATGHTNAQAVTGLHRRSQEYAFVALLKSSDSVCTAAILSSTWMVSSGHCRPEKESSGIMAYGGGNRYLAERNFTPSTAQQRLALPILWMDPVNGSLLTPNRSRQHAIMLLRTDEPWTITETLQPVGVSDMQPTVSELQENECVTVGLDSEQTLVSFTCFSSSHWTLPRVLCVDNGEGCPSDITTTNLLLYCHTTKALVGLGIGSRNHLSRSPGSTDEDDNFAGLPKGTCFAYVGREMEGAWRNATAYSSVPVGESRSREEDLLRPATQTAVKFLPATYIQKKRKVAMSTKETEEDEFAEYMRRHNFLVKRGFPEEYADEIADEALENAQWLAATNHPRAPSVKWLLIPVAVVTAYLIFTHREKIKGHFQQLTRCMH